jgi:ABC-2 type transport system ATP-binding protein
VIQVSNLTKYYGDYPAVQDVTFGVPRGKIVGFLGPNGAGKTTTMRILAGFLTATSGKATIDGFDVFWKPIEVRKRIGYLPENCPLYVEMRVWEYLHFRAGIKGLYGLKRRQRIDYVLKRCWLTDVQRQIIGTLSKGYRQRVGLADALLASPPVLILDEPTAGLDPTQIISTRKLIRELGQEHTILLSTHILPEVEATCDSVIIISRGRVAASSALNELTAQAGEKSNLVALIDGPVDAEDLRELPGMLDMSAEPTPGGLKIRISTNDPGGLAPWLCQLAVQKGYKVRELRQERQTLEELFIKITGPERTAV